MFDRSKLMRDAWAIYRRHWTGCRPANETTRKSSFAQALRDAWLWAKQETVRATRTAAQIADERLAELKSALMSIDARPWGMREHRIAEQRAAIIAEISALDSVPA